MLLFRIGQNIPETLNIVYELFFETKNVYLANSVFILKSLEHIDKAS